MDALSRVRSGRWATDHAEYGNIFGIIKCNVHWVNTVVLSSVKSLIPASLTVFLLLLLQR